MARKVTRFLLSAGLACGLLAASVRAGDDVQPSGDHTMQRAGYPQRVSCIAAPSDTGAYIGYLVGGGVHCGGEGPNRLDGTWGWDYSGRWLHRHIFLLWTHGARYQGGTGAYKSDGPHIEHK